MFTKLGLRLIGRNTRRSMNIIRGMALPLMLIVAMFGIIIGISSVLLTIVGMAGSSQYLIVLQTGVGSFTESQIDPQVLSFLDHENVADILPQNVLDINITSKTYQETYRAATELWAVNFSDFQRFWGDEIYDFSWSDSPDNESISGVVGNRLASEIGISSTIVPVNVSISVKEEQGNITTVGKDDAKIVGIFQTSKRYQASFLIFPSDLTKIMGSSPKHLSVVEIKVKNPSEAPDTSQSLQERLRDLGFDVEVSPEGASEELVDLAVSDIMRVFWILVLFVFFLVFIQTYHATNWMIMRYEREIWILMTLGTSKWDLVLLFVQMAVILGNIALVMALVGGVLFVYMIFAFMAAVIRESSLVGVWDLNHLTITVVLANVTFLLGSLRPSLNAVGISLEVPRKAQLIPIARRFFE